MKRGLWCLFALFSPLSAVAVPFDFTTLGSNNTLLGNSVTVAGVKAEGLAFGLGGLVPEPLWLRNVDDDDGLGVCSEGASKCSSDGGDVNELSNEGIPEAIRLTLPAGSQWTELWVSSLDSGGTNNRESGILEWSNDPNFGTFNSFKFNFADFNPEVEGNILGLAAASGFNPTAHYLLFINDPSNGTNNDYLVWKGAYTASKLLQDAPEPGTIFLLCAALAAMHFYGRRSAA